MTPAGPGSPASAPGAGTGRHRPLWGRTAPRSGTP
jgi:hypothetical protein